MPNENLRLWQYECVGHLACPDLVGWSMLQLYYQIPIFRKGLKVSLNGLLAPPRSVQVGTEDHGGPGGKYRRSEEVVSEPVRNLTEGVGGGRQDQEHISPVGQLNVTGFLLYRGSSSSSTSSQTRATVDGESNRGSRR